MFSRIPPSLGQLSAQAPLVPEFAFAWAGLRTHLDTKAGLSLSPARPMGVTCVGPCDPSPDLAPGPLRTGRLSGLQDHRQSPACARKRVFLRLSDGVNSEFRTILNGGRACVFLPFSSLGLRPSLLRPVCRPVVAIRNRAISNRAMAISSPQPIRCKPKAAVRSPGRCLARPLPMPRMRTWLPVPPLAPWQAAQAAAFRGCRPAVERGIDRASRLIATAQARTEYTITKASRGAPPAGLLHCCARRPARVSGKEAECSRRS